MATAMPIAASVPFTRPLSGAQAGRGPAKASFSADDDRLLDEMERLSSCFFWEQANPDTGLVKDRCNARDAASDKNTVASIAATGFALTALCIAVERQFLAADAVRGRVLTTLRSLWETLPNHRGFFYHWADINTGERVWDSEVSSVDTALLLCGVLTCREFFHDREITRLANSIAERIDWTWLSEDTSLLPHGWLPEVGFLPYRWDYYSELMMMYLLALGSSSHPLPAETWDAWKRVRFDYEGMRYIGSFAPLFVHQYSQAWFDFRGKSDGYADYFHNSITATKVHRQFCLELGKQFHDYSEDLWGITASDSAKGYVIWGGPPMMGAIDGTVVPSATAGSLPFLPAESMRVLRTIRNKYPAAWTNYGFVDAFNPLTGWYDTDVVGIDTGISMLMAENARTGFVWNTFMRSAEAQRGMARAGFHLY
ncbi:MAG: hypothetical protein JOZ36_15400 [Acidobacteria bacterium]|nr:hypothetical protein [Acidobacteriota bacterium]